MPICFKLLESVLRAAASRTLDTAGSSIPTDIAVMLMAPPPSEFMVTVAVISFPSRFSGGSASHSSNTFTAPRPNSPPMASGRSAIGRGFLASALPRTASSMSAFIFASFLRPESAAVRSVFSASLADASSGYDARRSTFAPWPRIAPSVRDSARSRERTSSGSSIGSVAGTCDTFTAATRCRLPLDASLMADARAPTFAGSLLK